MKLLIGGSPCTKWSIAQKNGRETEPSGIGWELFLNFLIAKEKYKPEFFLYENNKSMSPAIRAEITKRLGVEPIGINSALLSGQNRERLYWTNIPGVTQPEDKGILLRDVLESGISLREKGYALVATAKSITAEDVICRRRRNGVAEPLNITENGKAYGLKAQYYKSSVANFINGGGHYPQTGVAEPIRIGTIESTVKKPENDSQQYRVYSPDGKSVTLCGQGGGMGAKTGLYAVPTGPYDPEQNGLIFTTEDGKAYPVYEVKDGQITIRGEKHPIRLADGFYIIRKLTVLECKRLQTVPDDYIFPVSDTQAYKMLGNGWTVDVIAHILSFCPGIKTRKLDVLSMYDGMACGHIALDKLGAKIRSYYATEIDKYCIQTVRANFQDVTQLGDAFQVRDEGWSIEVEPEEQRTILAKLPLKEMPTSCATCGMGRRYGCVGDVYCRLLDEYFTGNTRPPHKERPDECPLFLDKNGQFEAIRAPNYPI